MNARTPLVLAAAAFALAAAGCSSSDATAADPATAAPTTAATATAASATATAGASAAPVASQAAEPVAGGKGCPASEATLLKAFRDSDTAKHLLPTDTLTDINCYQGYAIAKTQPREGDKSHVVYHYAGGAWQVLDGGTGDYCETGVPADVRSHLHC